MKKIAVIFFTLIFAVYANQQQALAATADIKNLTFTTMPTSVAVDEISPAITVQTQNAEGSAEQVDETNDVTFTSTSASGQFLNGSGNTVSTTMSKNTASRTFYYKDSTSGTHTLTVEIKGRTSGITFSASQDITVGGVTIGGNTGTTTSSSTSTPASVPAGGAGGAISAHSEQEDVSVADIASTFKASVGRERIASIHVPVEFRAVTSAAPANYGLSYFWSFGDGVTAIGEYVTHQYAFSGDYNVVMTTSAGNVHAVSRTKVKVIMPDVDIINVLPGNGGFVELKNNSQNEVNVGGWNIRAQSGESFTIPKDTIISPKASIKLGFAFRAEVSGRIVLAYPNLIEEAYYDMPNIAPLPSVSVSASTSEPEMEARVSAAKERLAVWRKEWNMTHQPTTSLAQTEDSIPSIDKTATLVDAVKKKESGSILSSILDAPAGAIRLLKGLFEGIGKW